jgi:hypothetical protein
MPPEKPPTPKRPPVRNLVAIDGTLDKLSSLEIHVQEKGRRALAWEIRIIHKDAIREHIDCSNPLCQMGGFSLGDVVRDMVKGQQRDFIGTNFCTGQEGDLEKPETLRSCETRFEVEAILRFKN